MPEKFAATKEAMRHASKMLLIILTLACISYFFDPVDKKNLVSLVSLIQRAIADQGALVSIVILKAEKTSNP